MTVLVIGARGHTGAAVLDGLRTAGVTVRASSRDPRPGDFPPGVEVVRLDLTEPESFPAALAGVQKVFLYANSRHAADFAAAAHRAGVEHLVLLSSNSVLFPDADRNPTALEHLQVEQALQESRVDWTFVRAGYLATNTFRWQATIRAERVVRTAFPDGGTPLVHERDLGAVAVRALLDDAYRNTSHLVLGGAWLSEREQVAAIAAALHEPVRLEILDVDAYRIELTRAGVPEVFVEPLLQAKGEVPQVPEHLRVDAVPAVLGRPPTTFAAWAHDHAADFR